MKADICSYLFICIFYLYLLFFIYLCFFSKFIIIILLLYLLLLNRFIIDWFIIYIFIYLFICAFIEHALPVIAIVYLRKVSQLVPCIVKRSSLYLNGHTTWISGRDRQGRI